MFAASLVPYFKDNSMSITKEIFRGSLAYQVEYNLTEPLTNKGFLHDYMHYFFRLSPSVDNEILLQQIEWVLSGLGSVEDISSRAASLYSRLTPEFLALWNSVDFN